MAMLAEPRRRQKWGLNPRGTLWSDDQNKFGQKLMEKMGWNKGEGLGKEGQGITEHIKVNHKDNTKGVGYKGKDDEWVKHVDAFENVLAALNSENNSADNSANNSPNNSPNNSASNSPANSEDEDEETKSRKSLEKRSKDSRARVHYHKFTRGKDLSNYKEDDLACILGSKRSKRKDPIDNIEPKEEPIVKDCFGNEVGTTKKEHGVVTVAAGNYQEYFAKKMAALKKQREGNDTNLNDEDEEESALTTTENASLETKKHKKKKKKRDKDQLVTCDNDSNIDQTEENCNSTNENVEKKRKKKKYKTEDSNSKILVDPNNKEDDRPLFGFEFSCGFTNGTTVKKYPLNKHNVFSNDDVETSKNYENIKKNISTEELNKQISSENIKKKHKKDLESFHENVEVKEKKKKKKSKDVCNEKEDTIGISKNENSENGFEKVKKKKKKRCKNKNAEKISIVFENEKAAEFKQKDNVAKSKNTEETILIDCLPENSLKKKKKKNKIKMGDESLILEKESSKTNDDENVNLKEKRKGKKRKREEDEDDNDSSHSKKIKKMTEDISQKVSPGKNELKRREYWKKKTDEMARYNMAKRIKKKSKKKKTLKLEEKNNLANKVLTAFDGAKVPNIISKRDKKKLEQSRVP